MRNTTPVPVWLQPVKPAIQARQKMMNCFMIEDLGRFVECMRSMNYSESFKQRTDAPNPLPISFLSI